MDPLTSFDGLLSLLISDVISMCSISSEMTKYTPGNKSYYELEVRIHPPNNVNTVFIRSYNAWDTVVQCKEKRYQHYTVRKAVIRRKCWTNGEEITAKNEVTRIRHDALYASIVLSTEVACIVADHTLLSETEYISCTKRVGPLMLDARWYSDDTHRVEIEVLDMTDINAIEETLRLIIPPIFCGWHGTDTAIAPHVYNTLLPMVIKPYLAHARMDLSTSKCHNPKHVSASSMGTIIGDWMCTPKLDGERRFLCVNHTGIYGINRSMEIHIIRDMSHSGITMLDTEYHSGKYHVFDALMYDNMDITHLSLDGRLAYARNAIDTYTLGDICLIKRYDRDVDSVVKQVISSDVYDGIILVNNQGHYNHEQYKIKKHNTYDLICTSGMLSSSDGVSYGTMKLPDGIYEFASDDGKHRMLKKRDDKVTANHSSVINAMVSSVTIADMQARCFDTMRSYHNMVKRTLLSLSSIAIKSPVLLDIGSGMGGDYSKWKSFGHVYCVEPSAKALSGFRSRHGNPQLCTLINAHIRDHGRIRSYIEDPIDVVTIFFSYMMFTDSDIAGLIKVIESKTSSNCVIYVITTDIEAINKSMPKDGKYTNGYTIQRTGNILRVTIPDSNVVDNVEYINDITTLTKSLATLGFKLYNKPRRLCGDVPLSHGASQLSSMFVLLQYRRGYNNIKVPWYPALSKSANHGTRAAIVPLINADNAIVIDTKSNGIGDAMLNNGTPVYARECDTDLFRCAWNIMMDKDIA